MVNELNTMDQETDDQLTLELKVAIKAVNKEVCRNILKLIPSTVKCAKEKFVKLGMSADKVIIVVINVDDIHGGPLANALMPGQNWQEIRDRSEIHFVYGLANREKTQNHLKLFDQEASEKLEKMTSIAVVIVDYGVAEVVPV